MKRRANKSTSLTLNLHENQARVFTCTKRFRVLVCGRRFGKSRLDLTELITVAISYQGTYDLANPPVVLCAMPTLKQAKKIFWTPLLNLLHNNPLVSNINRSDHIINFYGDRPDIVVLGANDSEADGIRGLRIYFAALDEYQAFKPAILDEVIIPAMADTPGSRALITLTPKGKLSHAYKLKERAESKPNWAYFHFFTADNPFIGRSEIREAKLTLPPRVYRQEYEASWEDFEGQIFSELTDENILDADLIPTKFEAVYVGHDPGDIHPAITVIGLSKRKYYVIEIWESDGLSPVPNPIVENKVAELCQKYDAYRVYNDPSRPVIIQDFRRRGKKDAIKAMARAVAGHNRIEEGLMVINSLFYQKRLLIEARLERFIDQCRSYHRKTDKDGRVLEEVEDGQDDHTLDAMRMILATLHSSGIDSLVA